jgi:hypothetical protein
VSHNRRIVAARRLIKGLSVGGLLQKADTNTLRVDDATNSSWRRDGIRVLGEGSETAEGPAVWSSVRGHAFFRLCGV